MKRNILLFSLLMLVCISLVADTDVPAGDVTGTWNLAGSPYNILGNIQVPEDEQLNIEAGVSINFTGHYKFNIYGTIIAEGSQMMPITFTTDDPETGWHGLRFINTTTTIQDPSTLEYCNFTYGVATGVAPDYQGGMLYCINSSGLTVDHCSFSNNYATTGGAIYLENSDITLQYVEITDNEAAGAGGGVYLNGSDAEFSDVEITGNVSLYDGGGVNCFNSDPTFIRTIFAGNETQWNGGAISVFNNSDVILEKVTIYDNLAEQDGSAFACLFASTVEMVNSIVWNNAYNNPVYVETGTTFTATYSDFQQGSGQSWFGEGCISADPLFANPAAGNFALTWDNMPTPDETKSPCIDTGDPDSDLDPDGTVADMGAVYYAQSGLQGVVTLDGGNGTVSDVTITVTLTVDPFTEYTTNPDAEGNYLITTASGTYDVQAVLAGYSSFTSENVVISNELVTLNFTLTPPPPGEIIGQVDVEGIGNPEEVTITASSVTTNPYAVLDPGTGAVLYYEYTLSISPGTYDVIATMPGYVTQTEEDVVVESGQQTTDIDFYLPLTQNEGYITGYVTLIGGAGNVEDVIVSAGEEQVSPDDEGYYEITILNGTYDVTATVDGYSTLTRSDIPVTAFEYTQDVNFDLIDGWEQIEGTQYSMIIYSTVTYDGQFMPGGNSYQLAAFGWDDTGTVEECRGTATWIPGNHFFWDCYWDLDGFWYFTIVSDDNSGEELIWFDFYNAEDNTIYDCNEGILFTNGSYDTGINFTIDSPEHDFEYDLVQNWNWISFGLNPASSDLDDIFPDLEVVPDIYQIKNQTTSAVYYPDTDFWGGTLSNIAYDEGYKINMLNEYEGFTFTGQKYNPCLYPINIQEGWNWLNYLEDEPLELTEALASLSINDSTCIKTQNKSAVYFGGWMGDLEMMYPGKAYLLNWPAEISPENPVYLTYPPITDEESRYIPAENDHNLADWEVVTGNKSNMVLMADLRIKGNSVTDNSRYTAGIFDNENNCRAVGKFTNGIWYFTVAGDKTELLSIRLYDSAAGLTFEADASLHYVSDDIAGSPQEPLTFDFNQQPQPDQDIAAFSLSGNYPNPFNPVTSISYNLPLEGDVLLQIYNVKGQLVETLVNSSQTAGTHSVVWNADQQSSGVYFYKLQHNGNSSMKKCILMK